VPSREEPQEIWPALRESEAKKPAGTPKARLAQALKGMLIGMRLTARRGSCWALEHASNIACTRRR
jgi:hypothetical protein